MIHFTNDYSEGAHPAILDALLQNNMVQMPGYSEDEITAQAREYIRARCSAPKADVHFVPGGTQANTLVIAACLKPYQAVIAAASGHIAVHETGAIEATGHKVIELPAKQGKITASQVQQTVARHWADPAHEHTVMPKMCYISNPTEYGTLYTREELQQLHEVCRENGLFLYLDGARLGYGLCAAENTLDLPFLAQCCDAFYIGGTKVGALFGEAIVICNPAIGQDFRYTIKQRGAMLAKGWLLGLQFKTLFEGDLYFEGARQGIQMAQILAEGLEKAGVRLLMPPAANQLFPILPQSVIDKLAEKYSFEIWEKTSEQESAVRFCTSWATQKEHVESLVQDLTQLIQNAESRKP